MLILLSMNLLWQCAEEASLVDSAARVQAHLPGIACLQEGAVDHPVTRSTLDLGGGGGL